MEREEKIIIGIMAFVILIIIIFGLLVWTDSLPKPPVPAGYVVRR